jgi:hypothetical protein
VLDSGTKAWLIFFFWGATFIGITGLNVMSIAKSVPRFDLSYYRPFLRTIGRTYADRGTKKWKDEGFNDTEIKLIQAKQNAVVLETYVAAIIIVLVIENIP